MRFSLSSIIYECRFDFSASKSDFLAIIFSGVGLAVSLTKSHYAAYIPSPKGLTLVHMSRSLTLTRHAHRVSIGRWTGFTPQRIKTKKNPHNYLHNSYGGSGGY